MASFQTQVMLPMHSKDVVHGCQQSAKDLKWSVLEVNADSVTLKVAGSDNVWGYKATSKLIVSIKAKNAGSIIDFVISTPGLGPIANKWLQEAVGNLINSLTLIGKNLGNTPATGSDLSGQLEKLADLFSKGLIDEDEFKNAKKKLIG